MRATARSTRRAAPPRQQCDDRAAGVGAGSCLPSSGVAPRSRPSGARARCATRSASPGSLLRPRRPSGRLPRRAAPRSSWRAVGLSGDLRDHQRLGVRGLVLLVVPEAPVADEVDDDVVTELLAVRASASRTAAIAASGSSALTWMIGMSNPFGEVARVASRAAFVRVGREADLVVRRSGGTCRRSCSRRGSRG